MGTWAVIAQSVSSDAHVTEFICRGRETKEEALEKLRAAVHTYLPKRNIREKRRQVYRFADQESYLVMINGKLTEWECSLRLAELISDSADPARPADQPDPAAAAGPQDRIPPGY
ncbi:hypothetical protein [Streptomyces graminilatus]|uniref:hypothetical protein n=1 Tax=Streptomyces graminilatus TaxID=1464070 RepID=UPI0006E31E87|nr:hypothetical protein [Streptomyces graminilatus]